MFHFQLILMMMCNLSQVSPRLQTYMKKTKIYRWTSETKLHSRIHGGKDYDQRNVLKSRNTQTHVHTHHTHIHHTYSRTRTHTHTHTHTHSARTHARIFFSKLNLRKGGSDSLTFRRVYTFSPFSSLCLFVCRFVRGNNICRQFAVLPNPHKAGVLLLTSCVFICFLIFNSNTIQYSTINLYYLFREICLQWDKNNLQTHLHTGLHTHTCILTLNNTVTSLTSMVGNPKQR